MGQQEQQRAPGRDGFKARSGCFACGCCGRLTRRTSKGNSTLCPHCDDWTMAENAISDYGDDMTPEELAGQEAFIAAKKQEAVNLGGKLEGFAKATGSN